MKNKKKIPDNTQEWETMWLFVYKGSSYNSAEMSEPLTPLTTLNFTRAIHSRAERLWLYVDNINQNNSIQVHMRLLKIIKNCERC